MRRTLQTLKKGYLSVAVIVLNTLVLLIAINVCLGVVYAVMDFRSSSEGLHSNTEIPKTASGYFYTNGAPVDNGKRRFADLAVFDYTAYEGAMSEEQVNLLLDETFEFSTAGVDYQPWVQFGPRTFAGTLLNVDTDARGFPVRRTLNPMTVDPAHRIIRVFTFGGSTTFGVGVADEHTWPSLLSRILNQRARAAGLDATIEVVNYGRRSYFPSLESVLLMDLFRIGHRPDLVIFLDGLNWGEAEDIPNWTRVFRKRMQAAQSAKVPESWNSIPLVRLANSIGHRTTSAEVATNVELPAVEHVVERFLQSHETVRHLCAQYKSESLFFLQPDAMYNYPTSLYRAPEVSVRPTDRERRGHFYADMIKHEEYVDLTGLFERWGRKAVVDMGHYSPKFNRFVADNIAQKIDLEQLLRKPASKQSTPTGAPRSSGDPRAGTDRQ